MDKLSYFPALMTSPTDCKVLVKRCESLEGLGRFEEAVRDAMRAQILNPNNQDVTACIDRLKMKVKN